MLSHEIQNRKAWDRAGCCEGSELCLPCAAFRSVLFPLSFLKVLGFGALVYKLLTHLKSHVKESGIVTLEEGLPETEFLLL